MSRDPGLQPERTRLAWQRTSISGMLVGSGAALAAAHRQAPWVLVLAVVACAVAGGAALAGVRLPLGEPYGRLVLGVAVTLTLAVVGVVLALS
jgi:hypothetical protein